MKALPTLPPSPPGDATRPATGAGGARRAGEDRAGEATQGAVEFLALLPLPVVPTQSASIPPGLMSKGTALAPVEGMPTTLAASAGELAAADAAASANPKSLVEGMRNLLTNTPAPLSAAGEIAAAPVDGGPPLPAELLAEAPAGARAGAEASPQASGLAAAAPPASVNAATATVVPTATPSAPAVVVADPEWPRAAGEHIMRSLADGVDHVELRLEPPDLGRVRINMRLDQDQVMLQFQAGNQAAREALELALPRLREMFADQGLNLTQADVGAEGGDGGFAGDSRGDWPAASAGPAGGEIEATAGGAAGQRPMPQGLLDTYA